jgi:Domain of unknown function (DUF397).
MQTGHTLSPQLTNPPTIRWQKSSHSGDNGNCVEVAPLPSNLIGIRDSKNPAGPILQVSHREWHSFITKVRADKME